MNILKQLQELVSAQVITQETADSIADFYRQKESGKPSRLILVLAVLGALLVGMGVILIIAHNWDHFPRIIRVFLAFLPLALSQLICGYTLLKRADSGLWREVSASLLYFSIGASIALVAQIYQIPGGTGSFMRTWMLLFLPVIYLMNSTVGAILYLAGITYYLIYTRYFANLAEDGSYLLYWGFLLLVMPYIWRKYHRPGQDAPLYFNWLLPISLTLGVISMSDGAGKLHMLALLCLFSAFYQLGRYFENLRMRNKGWLVIGALGAVICMMIMTYGSFWMGSNGLVLSDLEWDNNTFPAAPVAAMGTFALATVLFFCGEKQWKTIEPLDLVFGIGLVFVFIDGFFHVAQLLANLTVLFTGVYYIRKGVDNNHLGVLNFGLVIIAVLAACRFFDDNISFVIRGLLFILAGVGFFTANYLFLRKRRRSEK